MRKKAQASIDFLMTYGWALIVIVGVLGALYFLLGSPTNQVPDSCSFGDSFICNDFKVDTATKVMTLSLKNTVGMNINVQTISCTLDNNRNVITAGPLAVNSGDSFTLNCPLNGVVDGKINVDTTIVYVKQGMSFPTSSDGLVIATPN